jgi:hypothetical protein
MRNKEGIRERQTAQDAGEPLIMLPKIFESRVAVENKMKKE